MADTCVAAATCRKIENIDHLPDISYTIGREMSPEIALFLPWKNPGRYT